MPISARDEHRGHGPDRGSPLDVPLLLRNQNFPASNGVVFERLSPITGQVVSRAAAATPADAAAAVASAAAAFPKWSAVGPGERRERLLAAAGIIEDRANLFITAMAEEIGATAGWARFNIELAANMLREAAAATKRIGGEVIPSDRPAWCSELRRGMHRSYWVCGPSPCRSLAVTP
jgi:acyl-CoA reductase-like NAD-dependent aldehyde dehydrogenase